MRSRAASISLKLITPRQCGRKIDNQQDRLVSVECFPDFAGQLLRIERFWQEKHFRFAAVAWLKRFFEISGDKKNFGFGISRAQGIGKTAPAHLRHHQIGEKEVDFSAAVFTEQTLSVIAIGRFDYLVTETTEHAHGDMTDTDVVFENKNGFGAAARFLAIWFFVRRRRRRRYAWEISFDDGAFA